jgi:NADH-quinone oxidoreductase subunit G
LKIISKNINVPGNKLIMAKIYINGKEFNVKPEKNLLETSLELGFDLPYFCWHPKLGSVGACRQCAVKKFKDDKDTRGRIVMACMEPSSEGSIISIDDPEAKMFRGNVIEALMTNHPHDCPVCDEGGDCHLQDMTVMSGHNYRRYKYSKRTYRNQYLGPFINHEMNRCIQCYRCVRFYRDYAGGNDLNAFASHNHVFFGRTNDGVLENEFSGNLVEVCPTGVFTDKTLKDHYTRKWDLTMAPSICSNCSVGCNTIAAERYGSLRRIYSRYNGQVNGYFLCDRGRFGYEFVNSKNRVRNFSTKNEQASTPVIATREKTIGELAGIFKDKKFIGIGSPRASIESNFALRMLVGESNFSHGLSAREESLNKLALEILQKGDVRTPSLRELENADAVFLLGEDVTQTAPMIALALRQAAKNIPKTKATKTGIPAWNDAAIREIIQRDHGPFYIAAPAKTRLDDIATEKYYHAPDNIARLGFAVAHFINQSSELPQGLSESEKNLASSIARDLSAASNPLIVSGVNSRNEYILKAAANIAWALKKSGKNAGLHLALSESNSAGATMMGGMTLEKAFGEVKAGKADGVIILENDIYRRLPARDADTFLNSCKYLVVMDHSVSQTTKRANILIPVGTFAESDGTLVNNEGRAQRYYQVYMPEEDIRESWRRIGDISEAAGNSTRFSSLYDLSVAISRSMSQFAGIESITPPPDFRINGQKIPRATHRYSGRTAMHAHVDVSEPKPAEDVDTPLSFTMEGFQGEPPSSVIPFFWNPGWNSVQAINKYQIEIGGALHDGDPGKRLIEPSAGGHPFFKEFPAAFKADQGDIKIFPVYHIFGSEEFSAQSPAVAERVPAFYIAFNKDDAERMKIPEGSEVELSFDGFPMKAKAVIMHDLAQGMAVVPEGFSGIPPVINVKLAGK